MLGLAPLLKRIAAWLEREPGPDEVWCALTRGPCWKHRCHQYVHILGTDPQSEKAIDHFDCAFKWLPTLQIEASKETRQLSADVQSFRNENTRGLERTRRTIAAAAILTARDDQQREAIADAMDKHVGAPADPPAALIENGEAHADHDHC